MFSGKSSNLMSEINRYKYITDKIFVINHILDKERHIDLKINDEGVGSIRTHDNKEFPAIMLNNLSELYTNEFFNQKYNTSEIIIIDEGQFYTDLYDFLKYEVNQCNKTFIVGGLSADSNMNSIGDITKLVPMADEIQLLKAYCIYCKDGTVASFTKKENNDNTSQIVIGNSDIYSPVCRIHFNT
jgi:thymidine kinase